METPLIIMQNFELYFLIAVFLLLTVIIVWMGAKTIHAMRHQKQEQEKRRQAWQEKIRRQRDCNV